MIGTLFGHLRDNATAHTMPNENDGFPLRIQELADAVDVALQRHLRHWCLIFPMPRQVRSQDRVAVFLQRSHDLVPTPSTVECSVNKDECAHLILLFLVAVRYELRHG